MTIHTKNRTTGKPDFDDVMNEVEQEIEEQRAEEEIVSRVPELKQLNSNITKAIKALNDAKTSLDTAVKEYRSVVAKTGATARSFYTKIDSINTHIDGVMADAPSKLTVSISATDADMETFQGEINKEHQFLIEEFKKHNKAANDALIYARRDYMYRYKETEGIYFGHISQWYFLFFYSIGIFGFVSVIAWVAVNHWTK